MLINPHFCDALWLREVNPEFIDNVRIIHTETEFRMQLRVDGEWGGNFGFEKITDGVYHSDGISNNFLRFAYGGDLVDDLSGFSKYLGMDLWSDEFRPFWDMMFYGVGDSVSQILSHPEIQKHFIESIHPFVMLVTKITKAGQPQRDGWRWHKWGSYIGDYKPRAEYLFDEPDINEVWLFSFCMLPARICPACENLM